MDMYPISAFRNHNSVLLMVMNEDHEGVLCRELSTGAGVAL